MTTPPTHRNFPLPPDAVALLARLDKLGVEHVLIGELAAAIHGCRWSDDTVTVVPARYARNLDRLARGLRELHASPRTDADTAPVSWEPTAERLRQRGRLALTTMLGELEIDFEPPATAGHLDLFENARRHTIIPGLEVQVAALEDLIRIAEMRSGPADRAFLPVLHETARPAPLASA
jgi:hypothetical protein